jgi:hypothetical protein
MRDCIKRDRLIHDWHEAVLKFSDSLSRLRKCAASRFADQHKATEIARLHCENARMMLDVHRPSNPSETNQPVTHIWMVTVPR